MNTFEQSLYYCNTKMVHIAATLILLVVVVVVVVVVCVCVCSLSHFTLPVPPLEPLPT